MADGYLGMTLRLQINDAGTWRDLAGARMDSFKGKANGMEVTCKDSGFWRTLIAGGVRSGTLAFTGIFRNAAAQRAAMALALDPTLNQWQLVDNGTGVPEATFYGVLTDCSRAGAHSDFESFALTIESSGTPGQAAPVATPSIVLAGSSATITCATSGASIFYVTDGSTPTSSSTLYTGPVTLTSGQTIKAIGIKSGLVDSAVASAVYMAPTAFVALFAHDSGTAGYRPWKIDAGAMAQLTSGQWPGSSSPTNYQDFVPFLIPGGVNSGKIGAVVGSGVNTGANATIISGSDSTGQAGWSTVVGETSKWYTENGISLGASGGETLLWINDKRLIKITTTAGASYPPSTIQTSTDGGTSFTVPASTGFSGSWSGTIAANLRAHVGRSASGDGYMIAVMQSPIGGGQNGVCKVSENAGNNWTICTCPGTVVAIDYDWINARYIAFSKGNTGGSYGTTITVYTCATVNGTWVPTGQTITETQTGAGQGNTNFEIVGNYIYVQISITAGVDLYRALLSTITTGGTFSSVNHIGISLVSIAKHSSVKLCSDGNLRHITQSTTNDYVSTDGGATWTAETGASNLSGQFCPAP